MTSPLKLEGVYCSFSFSERKGVAKAEENEYHGHFSEGCKYHGLIELNRIKANTLDTAFIGHGLRVPLQIHHNRRHG